MSERSVTTTQNRAHNAEDVVKPPLPTWAYLIVNPTIAAILRSPFHRLFSNSLMLLSFDGRTSGKRYTIPVGYMQQDQHVYIFSHARWWKNLPGQVVIIRLRGREVRGTVRRLEEPNEIAAMVQMTLTQRGAKMVERMGLMDYADAQRSSPLPQRTTFFEITLDAATG